MAAIDDLKNSILEANSKLERLQSAVDRVVAAVDPSLQAEIAQSASNVQALGNALLELETRIDRVAPPVVPEG